MFERAEIGSMMKDRQSTQIFLIANTNTASRDHFERQYRISNSVAHHLSNGKSLKYLKSIVNRLRF